MWKANFQNCSVGANCVRPCYKANLSEYGLIIDAEIQKISSVYKNSIQIDNYVIMPNHLHLIIRIDVDGRTQFAPTISRIIKQFKGSITKQIGFSIWQKLFHDHIIRDHDEYNKIYKYIDNNPYKWEEDCYFEM